MRITPLLVLAALLVARPAVAASGPDARDIIRDAIDHYRGLTS